MAFTGDKRIFTVIPPNGVKNALIRQFKTTVDKFLAEHFRVFNYWHFKIYKRPCAGKKMSNESKKNTVERILLAAQSEFSSAGFDGASLERIAHEANVTKQLIYHYFQTKDQLYKMTLELVAGGMELPLDAETYRQLEVGDAIALVIKRITEQYRKHASYATLTLDQSLHHGAHITERSQFIPNMRYINSEIVQPILERGIGSGAFSPDLDTRFTYSLIFQVAAGCFLNSHVMSKTVDIDFDSEAGIEEWRTAATDFVLHALRNS